MSDSAHVFTLGIEEEFQIIAPAKKIHQEIDRVDQPERSFVRQDFLFPLVDDVGEGSCLRDDERMTPARIRVAEKQR